MTSLTSIRSSIRPEPASTKRTDFRLIILVEPEEGAARYFDGIFPDPTAAGGAKPQPALAEGGDRRLGLDRTAELVDGGIDQIGADRDRTRRSLVCDRRNESASVRKRAAAEQFLAQTVRPRIIAAALLAIAGFPVKTSSPTMPLRSRSPVP